MEVESEAMTTTETAGAVESAACQVQVSTSNDGDCDVPSKSVVESDASITVTGDSVLTPTVNNSSMAVDTRETTSTSSTVDVGVVESAGPSSSDLGPSTAPATTISDLSLQQGSSFDSSTQGSITAGVDTVQSAPHVNTPHLALLENDSSVTTTTTMNIATTEQDDAQRQDDELHSAAAVIDEPPPSLNSQQQEPQPHQHPEQPHEDEHVQVQEFKAG